MFASCEQGEAPDYVNDTFGLSGYVKVKQTIDGYETWVTSNMGNMGMSSAAGEVSADTGRSTWTPGLA